MSIVNHRFRLAARPIGSVKRSDFNYVQENVPELADKEILVKVSYISLDPAMRGWMNENRASYIEPVELGDVMRAIAVGRVIASKNPAFAVGDHVRGMLGMQEYAIVKEKGLNKLDLALAPLPVYLSTLGMPGLTAYFGLLDVGQPNKGDTVVVSGAAGAVGSIVGQIARIKGARAIGIAGGSEKACYLTDFLGFDGVIDYKKDNVAEALQKLCPHGINVFYDNVGGNILDAALANLAHGARVVLCGAISQYNNTDAFKCPDNYMNLMIKRASMRGVMVFDYYDRAEEAEKVLASWIAAGKLKTREDIVQGLETFPDTFQRLFTGANNGKLLLKVADS